MHVEFRQYILFINIKKYIFLEKYAFKCKGDGMLKKALLIIDIQNDITKNYKDIIDNINK